MRKSITTLIILVLLLTLSMLVSCDVELNVSQDSTNTRQSAITSPNTEKTDVTVITEYHDDTKNNYDMSNVVFDNVKVIYDGKEHSIFAMNVPDGVSVEYEGNGKKDVGTYVVTAKFTGDNVNYNEIPDMIAILTIEKANINISNVIFHDETVDYDGNMHSIVAKNLPSGIKASDIVYYYNGKEAKGVIDAGVYRVIAAFNSDNYYTVSNLEATLTIQRKSYSEKYAQYGVLGKTIDLINADDIETLSGGKKVFKDDLYYIDVYYEDIGKQEGKGYSSSSVEEIIDNMSASANLKIAFGARKNKNNGFLTNKVPTFNISGSFEYEKKKKTETSEYYYTYYYNMSGYRVDISGYKSPENFADLISDDLINDAIKVRNGSMSPKQFVNLWGTHVIMSAIYGEQVTVDYSAITNKAEDSTEWKAAIDAEFSMRFGKVGLDIGASADMKKLDTSVTSETIQNMLIKVKSKKPLAAVSLDSFTSQYQNWINSHDNNIDNSVFIDLPDNSLYCIWYLLGDEFSDVIEIMDNYMYSTCSELLKEKISAVNSFVLPDDVVFDKENQRIEINLQNYQESGNVSNLESSFFADGVLTINPAIDGTYIKEIVINGSYSLKNKSGQKINNEISGFSLKLDKAFDSDIKIYLNNVAFSVPDGKSAIDLSEITSNINVEIICNGTNILRGGDAISGDNVNIVLRNADEKSELSLYGNNDNYALFAKVNGYDFYFDLKKNTSFDINNVKIENNLLLVPTLNKNGYDFYGWAMDKNESVIFNDSISLDDLKQGDYIYLKAVWKVDPYTIGKYVENGTVVSDSNGENRFCVFNDISRTPQLVSFKDVCCGCYKYIVDWSGYTGEYNYITEVTKTGERYGGGNNNFDIYNGISEAYFVGNSNVKFKEVYIFLTNYSSDSNVTLHFADFNMNGYIRPWEQPNNLTVTIDVTGNCVIEAPEEATAIQLYQGQNSIVSFTGSGNLTVYGGNGRNASENGAAGGNGRDGICADNVYIGITGSITVYGGNGGNGKDGEDGLNGSGNNSPGQEGKKGGNGGNGASAIKCGYIYSEYSKVNLTAGNGGSGGKGGNGGNGTRDNAPWSNGKNKGGNGGTGGDGGKCADALQTSSFQILSVIVCNEGIVGSGGIGGNGGNGGPGNTSLAFGPGGIGGEGGAGGWNGDHTEQAGSGSTGATGD